MRDFTLTTYRQLVKAFLDNNYAFQTFSDYLRTPFERCVILRHDIDLKKKSALVFAQLENELNIVATYFFRITPLIFDEKIIKKIAALDHEIGYHYEDLSLAKGDREQAILLFEKHLQKLRNLYPIKTICMHGKSLSKYDSKRLWDTYNYRDYDLIGEPYFDIDFNKVLYLTDTAQRWNGDKISVRDKVESNYNFSFRTTFDILENIQNLPNQIMLTVHPDRWTDNIIEWHRINLLVKVKNVIKKKFLQKRASKSI